MEVYLRLSGRSAEEAFVQAKEIGGGVGLAVDVDLVSGIGPALVSALDELGPVMVLAALSGAPGQVGVAAARLARLGASWITVSALAGPAAVEAAVAAVAGTGCGVAVSTVPPGVDSAAVAVLTGSSRGRLVSRMAKVADGAGASGVIAEVADLGVLAQVAPGLVRIVAASPGAEDWEEAERRGAGVLVLTDLASLRAFRRARGAEPATTAVGKRRR